jgi:hypothetical protein
MQRALAFVLLAGCATSPEDKGVEEAIPDGKNDSFGNPTEHGDLRFGTPSRAAFTEVERFHSWTFTLTAKASVALATELETPNLDSVMYLYKKRSNGSWGAFLHRNDDAGDDTMASRLDVELAKGEYRLIVKAFKQTQRGTFSVEGTCSGAGCPVTTCEAAEDLPAETGYGTGCDAAFAKLFGDGTIASTRSASITVDERCGLAAVDRRAVDYYLSYWNDLGGLDDPDAELSVDTSVTGAGGILVDVGDGGDESAITFLFDSSEALVALYQHNQSPDANLYCRSSGAERALPAGAACMEALIGDLPHTDTDPAFIVEQICTADF